MLLEILPIQLYCLTNVKVLFRNNNSAILHKVLHENLTDKEMYLSSVAILFVIKGKQVITNYDGTKVIVKQNELLYLSKDMYLVSDFVTENNEFEAVIFFFDDEFVEAKSSIDKSSKKTNHKIPTLLADVQIQKYVHSLLNIYLNSNSSHELLSLKLSELLALIKLQDGEEGFLSLFNSFLQPKDKRDIREFMKRNYLKNLNVQDYASLTGRSKSTFIREFKNLYNTTPNKWLIDQRLEKARQILIKNNQNVTDTAFEVGYENVSHFINAYKKKFSVTPKQSKSDTLTRIPY
jgi:AraC-like DNA-binding protein